MEKRINKKVSTYIYDFKNDIVSKLKKTLDTYPYDGSEHITTNINEIIDYIYNYDTIEKKNVDITKEDFQKRKRVKNTVPMYERCCAKRANGDQCTRRKRDGSQFCGTHCKGTPHGNIDDIAAAEENIKVDVITVEIKGIVYYVDDNGNVYDTEDILSNKTNPRVIAKYNKIGDSYEIPSLFSN
jgi:hypothetical protein